MASTSTTSTTDVRGYLDPIRCFVVLGIAGAVGFLSPGAGTFIACVGAMWILRPAYLEALRRTAKVPKAERSHTMEYSLGLLVGGPIVLICVLAVLLTGAHPIAALFAAIPGLLCYVVGALLGRIVDGLRLPPVDDEPAPPQPMDWEMKLGLSTLAGCVAIGIALGAVHEGVTGGFAGVFIGLILGLCPAGVMSVIGRKMDRST